MSAQLIFLSKANSLDISRLKASELKYLRVVKMEQAVMSPVQQLLVKRGNAKSLCPRIQIRGNLADE